MQSKSTYERLCEVLEKGRVEIDRRGAYVWLDGLKWSYKRNGDNGKPVFTKR